MEAKATKHPPSQPLHHLQGSVTVHRLTSDKQKIHKITSAFNLFKIISDISFFQALKEIARVSEELCSYQDEIRNKSGNKR